LTRLQKKFIIFLLNCLQLDVGGQIIPAGDFFPCERASDTFASVIERELGAIERMRAIGTSRRWQLRAVIVSAAVLVPFLMRSDSRAAILPPEQIDFSASDLERSIRDDSSGAGATSDSRNSDPSQSDEQSQQQQLINLLQSNLPSGGSSAGSSSTSSSSSGGSSSANAIGWSLNSTIAIRDDAPLGRLPEDHGLSLPDPPGTDLLRPPRG
jgi:hypothetical protein